MLEPADVTDLPSWVLPSGGLALLLVGGWLGAPGDAQSIAQASLCTAAGLGCWALAGARAMGGSLADSLGLRPTRANVSAADALLLVAGMLALSQLIDLSLQWMALRETGRLGELDGLMREGSRTGLLWAVAGMVVAPALAEELLFRGFVLGALRPRIGDAAALAASAALFGLVHLEWVHGLAAAALGLYLGAIRLSTGSIRLAVLCHLGNNAAAVAVARGAAGPGPLSGAPLLALIATCVLICTAASCRLLSMRPADGAP